MLLLLDYGAPVNAADSEGNTPMRSLADSGCSDMVLTLLNRGAGPNGRNRSGETPLARVQPVVPRKFKSTHPGLDLDWCSGDIDHGEETA